MAFTADDYLMHHGIKGQKWGIRRYQNSDGSLTPAGVKRYGTVKNFRKGLTLKQVKKNRAQKEKAYQEAQKQKAKETLEKQQHEAAKERAIASGDAVGVYKYRDEMSTKELSDALQRVNMAKQLSAMQPPPKESIGRKLAKKVGTTALNTSLSLAVSAGKLVGKGAFYTVFGLPYLAGARALASHAKAVERQKEEAKAIREGKLAGLKKGAEDNAKYEYLKERREEREKAQAKIDKKEQKKQDRKQKKKDKLYNTKPEVFSKDSWGVPTNALSFKSDGSKGSRFSTQKYESVSVGREQARRMMINLSWDKTNLRQAEYQAKKGERLLMGSWVKD